jgi:hypothetical protein
MSTGGEKFCPSLVFLIVTWYRPVASPHWTPGKSPSTTADETIRRTHRYKLSRILG